MFSVPRKLFLPQGSADTLTIHPLAKAFPPLSVKEFDALVEDIRTHGLREAIALYEGQILDGVHRYAACCKAKVEPWAVDFKGDRAAAIAFVKSKNAMRRHLTAAGKRKAIAALLQANPEQSDRQIAKVVQTSPSTVGATRKKMEEAGDVSKLDTRRDTKGRRQVSRKPRRSNRATKRGHNAASSAPATTSAAPAPATTSAAPAPSATSAAAGGNGKVSLEQQIKDDRQYARDIVKLDRAAAQLLRAILINQRRRDAFIDALAGALKNSSDGNDVDAAESAEVRRAANAAADLAGAEEKAA